MSEQMTYTDETTAERAAATITQVLSGHHHRRGRDAWMDIAEIQDWADLTIPQIHAGLTLLSAQHRVILAPESNQKMLTAADREAAIWLGNQYKHLVKAL